MNIFELENEIDFINKKFITDENNKKQLLSKLNSLEEEIKNYSNEKIKLEKVMELMKNAAKYARNEAAKSISTMVSSCFDKIFDEDIKFVIELKESKSGIFADFYVVDPNGNKMDPIESRGGGIVDIVSLALRLAFSMIAKPSPEGPLVLDEPAKHLSQEYINSVSELLKEISSAYGRQVIMVTHNQFLAEKTDAAWSVEKNNFVSKVDKIK